MQDPSNLIEKDGAGASGGGTAVAPPPAAGRRSAPNRRPPRRLPRAARSWFRYTFSRDRLLNGLRNLLWVAPLTLLIWIYAEREQISPEPNVVVPIEVTTNDPNWVVSLLRPSDPTIIATLSGPKAQVEWVIQDIHNTDPRFGSGPVRIEVNKNLGAGERRIDASRISNDPRFISHGVTVSSCQPAWLDVYLDPMVTREVEVTAVSKPSNVANVTFNPRTVQVRGPESVLDKARASGRLVAEANISGRQELVGLNNQPESKPIPLSDVKVTLPKDLEKRNVSVVGPAVVQAEVSVKPGKDLTLQYVNVEVQVPVDVLEAYRITFEKTLPNVTVTGPEAIIDKMSSAAPTFADFKPKPVATFEVSQEEASAAGDGPHPKTVEFKLPPGVSYKSGPSTVTYTLTPR